MSFESATVKTTVATSPPACLFDTDQFSLLVVGIRPSKPCASAYWMQTSFASAAICCSKLFPPSACRIEGDVKTR